MKLHVFTVNNRKLFLKLFLSQIGLSVFNYRLYMALWKLRP